MNEYILIICVVFFGGFLQGLTGFGSILTSLPLLAMFMDIRTVIPLISLFALVINGVLFLQLRKHVHWRKLIAMLAATLPGIPLGVHALKTWNPGWLTLGIGIILVLFSAYSLLAHPRPRNLGRGWAAFAGFLAGALGGSIGANGPPVIVYSALQPWNKHEIKSMLCAYFFTAGLCISTTHLLSGLITSQVATFFVAGLPSLGLGLAGGMFAYRHIPGESYRRIALLLLGILGCFMLYKTIGTLG